MPEVPKQNTPRSQEPSNVTPAEDSEWTAVQEDLSHISSISNTSPHDSTQYSSRSEEIACVSHLAVCSNMVQPPDTSSLVLCCTIPTRTQTPHSGILLWTIAFGPRKDVSLCSTHIPTVLLQSHKVSDLEGSIYKLHVLHCQFHDF